MLDDRAVLVTGGTGSFGRRFTATVLARHRPRELVVFSRDEHKQAELAAWLGAGAAGRVRFVLGDVRDPAAVRGAMAGIDVVVHAAALKHVPAGEDNPLEFVKTNVLGAANLVDAAVDRGVAKVLALSSDKAAGPASVYGATKLCADRLFIAADRSAAPRGGTRFAVVRFGNFVGSRGSVVPAFRRIRRGDPLPITDPRMTRFWITLQQAVDFALTCLADMRGGEILVPKAPSMRLVDVARAIAPGRAFAVSRARPGERLHEVLLTADDARSAYEYPDRFLILPPAYPRDGNGAGRSCPEDFEYTSDGNDRWLSVEELRSMLEDLP
ncbi:MAG TPA: SDR family NAD(P)-dependent oxidoreductase [Micromonosporaceae bacterium]|nr:SDR family NAD(P)-dependent oxidoreductase [Micromonosporaceae bacterium]